MCAFNGLMGGIYESYKNPYKCELLKNKATTTYVQKYLYLMLQPAVIPTSCIKYLSFLFNV